MPIDPATDPHAGTRRRSGSATGCRSSFEAIGSTVFEGQVGVVFRFARGDAETVAVEDASYRTAGAHKSTGAWPDRDTIDALARTIGAKLVSATSAGNHRIMCEADSRDARGSTNAHLAKWLRRAMRVLVVLHAQHPIESVRVEGFDVRKRELEA